MKQILFALLLVSSFSASLFGQSGWFWQNPMPQGNSLIRVQCINTNLIYSIGESRSFVKSTDGGYTWKPGNIFCQDYNGYYYGDLTAFHFINELTGFVVNEYSGFRTTDGGNTWENIRYPIDGSIINAIRFLNASTGFAFGRKLYKTTDSGISWDTLRTFIDTSSYVSYYDFSVSDENNITVTGLVTVLHQAFIIRTTNGGANWVLQNGGLLAGFTPGRVIYLNALTGYITGFDSQNHINLLRTTNSGNNWQNIWTGYTGHPHDIYFPDLNTGYILYDQKKIIKTTNGGSNWSILNSFDTAYKSSAIAGTGSKIVAVGERGEISVSSNGGTSWNEVSSSITYQHLYSASFINSLTGTVVGNGGTILKTTNGGVNWAAQFTDTTSQYRQVQYFGPDIGYIYGIRSHLFKTTNGGANWTRTNLWPYFGNNVDIHISFCNSTTGVVNSGDKYIVTTDGGSNWTMRTAPTPISNHLVLIECITPTRWIVQWYLPSSPYGTYNKVSKTTNAGANWTEVKSFDLSEPVTLSIGHTDSNFVYISGGHYSRIRTTDFFVTFQELGNSQHWGSALSNVHFVNTNTGISTYGVIQVTTNSGFNWIPVSNITTYVNDIALINQNTAVAVSNYGAIMRINDLSNLGIQPIGNIVPENFMLFQNYPNPFNPVTKIKFDISSRAETGNIRLVIYDVLGRELAELVNEPLKPGSYETVWDAGSFASGIYFYMLSTDAFSETKKMVLLK